MKRRLLGLSILFIVLVVAGLLVASFFAGSIIKKGVETAGPQITKVGVTLDAASLAVLSGAGELRGLTIGNPAGFKAPAAFQIGSVAVEVVPRSVFSQKVIVHSIKVHAPEITFEGGLQGNNLSKLLDNIRGADASSSSGTNQPSTASSRRLQVDEFEVTGGKIHLNVNLLGEKSATVPLPDIHLADLGQNSEGMTGAELSEKLVHAVLESATKALTGQLASFGKDLGGVGQMVSTGAVQQVEQITKGFGNLFQKK